jgi:hypothetical protein
VTQAGCQFSTARLPKKCKIAGTRSCCIIYLTLAPISIDNLIPECPFVYLIVSTPRVPYVHVLHLIRIVQYGSYTIESLSIRILAKMIGGCFVIVFVLFSCLEATART